MNRAPAPVFRGRRSAALLFGRPCFRASGGDGRRTFFVVLGGFDGFNSLFCRRFGAFVRGGPDGPPGGLCGLLLRLLLAAAGAGAVRDASDAGGSSEGLLVVGAGLRDQVLGYAEPFGRGELLETGLPVQASTLRLEDFSISGSNRRCTSSEAASRP